MTLSEFVTARLDEDERVARGLRGATMMAGRRPDFYGCGGPAAEDYWKRFDPARLLREVTAKQALIDQVFRYEAKIDGEWGCCHSSREIRNGECEAIRPDDIAALGIIAGTWSSHPDYDPAWAPAEGGSR